MASSPTSSSYSASPFVASSSSSHPNFPQLPVMAMRQKIVDKIMENRVTLIVGETGCGKSSQIPQFLLEENIEPILCTQPRRFAVVAVARMVASARNCEVGGEVGYHIGHSRVFSAKSKIVFKTAGVLLDEMQEKGMNALKYKVIVLDEVHERSVESDLVLVCIKQFLLKCSDLRVVLMSATADISRYREYFKDLGRGERVEVLAIPSTGKKTIFQREVLYLDQVSEILGMNSDNLSMRYCSGPSPKVAEADIKPDVHTLIHKLVIHIHKNEPDMEKSILVFLPTYYALEQQWFLLKPFSEAFRVHILHRSIDTEQALKSMKIWKSHRKVILATNIAESSVTIPKVGYVIDSCRSLQVFWDGNRKTDSAELVWVSKSQAEQRRGRTGRTCDGRVYRLVTGPFFGQLEDYESPAILKLSLRLHVLQICCAETRAINEPKALLQKAMDPPDPDLVEDALDLLVHMHALRKPSSRGRHEPTFYGQLLASFSLSFDASVLILKFGNIGMLREGILLAILMDLQPLPILRPFGLENQFMEHTDNFYSGDSKLTGLGKKEMLYIANLCAFQFWQRVYKDKWRLDRLKSFVMLDENDTIKSVLPKIEEEWCSFHNLVLPAVHQVAETYDEILSSLHRYRPKFLLAHESLPLHYDPYEFQHICYLKCTESGNADALALESDDLEHGILRKCVALPYVGPYDFQTENVMTKFASIVKEMRMQLSENVSREQNGHPPDNRHHDAGGAPVCRFFAKGLCKRGTECWFSHSDSAVQAKKPLCHFVFTLQGCRSGDSCLFSHDSGSIALSGSDLSLCCPEDDYSDPNAFLQLLPAASDGYILLLDDIDLHFSSNLARHYDPSCIISTTSQTDLSILDQSALRDITVIGSSHPHQTIMTSAAENGIPWSQVKCVLWFPKFDDDHVEAQKSSLLTFFSYLAIRFFADVMCDVQVVLTLNNLRFSKLQVEKLARDSFFYLRDSFPFDEVRLGKLSDGMATKKEMFMSKSVSYVFDMYPPTEIQFGDYISTFRHSLNRSH